jgi:hypothetical protein
MNGEFQFATCRGRSLFGHQMKNTCVTVRANPQNRERFYSGMTSIALIDG